MPAEGLPPGINWGKIIVNTIRGVVLAGLLGILLLAFFPFIIPRAPSEEARSSEARAALGAMKDWARVVYGRTQLAPGLGDLGLGPSELNGSYFTHVDYSCGGDARHWSAKCRDVYKSPPHDLIVTVDLETGSANFNR